MKKQSFFVCMALIAVCFLYTGTAYMSQSYRLMDYYSEEAVDLITSVWNYFAQALGIAFFSLTLYQRRSKIHSFSFYAFCFFSGAVFMTISQLSMNASVIRWSGYLFNLHIGFYAALYLTFLSEHVSPKHSGLCFGAAYATASLGTYGLSLLNNGTFLTSKEITALFLICSSISIALVQWLQRIPEQEKETVFIPPFSVSQLWAVGMMGVICTIGSGLFFMQPIAHSVNWNLVRAFYAVGLIAAGWIIDLNRLTGEILAVATLTYPLIQAAMERNGVTGSVSLSLSYLFRGFFTLYYVVTFTDYGYKVESLRHLAPVGLLISRFVEALFSLLVLKVPLTPLQQLLFCAGCFFPLLLIFVPLEGNRFPTSKLSPSGLFALFSEQYALTMREEEILRLIQKGASDSEIADTLFIS